MSVSKINEGNFSKEIYKLIAENSPDILLQTTKTGKIIFMSRNVESVYGYKLDEIIGRHFRNFVPRKELPRYLFKMKEMASGKTIRGFRTFAKHKDGHLIPIELSGKIITYNNKSYFNAVMRDVSKKIEAEQALLESELQRKFILDTIPDLLFVINDEGFFTSYHGNVNNLYQPPGLFINKKVVDVLPKSLGITTMEYVEKALSTKKIQIFQYSLKIKNIKKWYEARMLAISKKDVISIIRDITSLKEQQDELIKNKEYLQTLFDSAAEIIFTIDKSKNIIIWNASAKKISGYHDKEIINKNFIKINLIYNSSEFESYLFDIFKNRKIKSFEIIINTKFKTKRIWKASPSIIYGESKELSEILFICKDITFKKNLPSKVLFGRSYIFLDRNNNRSFNIFKNELNKKCNGIVISREILDKIDSFSNKFNIEFIQLSSQNQIKNHINDLPSLFSLLDKKIKIKSIIFLDRLDYFYNKYPYNEIVSTLYKINDIVTQRNALLIIHLNPDLLTDDKIAILKEEFYEYTSKDINDTIIDKDLFEILQFIGSRNEKNVLVNYKEIGITFSISKITVSRKIDKLIGLNLIRSFRSGRTKIIDLTDEGKNLLINAKEF